MKISTYVSPTFGEVSIATMDGDKLCAVEFGPPSIIEGTFASHTFEGKVDPTILEKVILAVDNGQEYYESLSLIGTDFQKAVWKTLRQIRPGTTASYSEVAKFMGKPKATRAVAKAIATNQIAVIIPCHRVIHADGTINGYRWGNKRKELLLQREGAFTSS